VKITSTPKKPPPHLVLCLYVAAGVILLTFLLLQRFSRTSANPLVPKLQELPLQIGVWRGTEDTLGQDIVTTLQLDDYTLRAYQQHSEAFIWLYIGYYATRPSFSKHHSPILCYPGNGWQIVEKGFQSIDLPGGRVIQVSKLLVQKGSHQRLVLYWHQWGDHVSTEEDSWLTSLVNVFKEYKLKVDSGIQTKVLRTDKALVRVDAPIFQSVDATLSHEISFVQSAFPLLANHFALSVPAY
jgi:EpsI family protein